MDHTAEMSCVLKVNPQCETCRRKVMEVLQCLHGGYNISIDAEQGSVKVTGRVTPNAVLRTLERYGKHAEVKWIGFDGEVMRGVGYYYGESGLPSPYSYPELDGYDYQPYGGPNYPWNDSYGHLPPPPPPPMYQPPAAPPPVYPPPPPPMYPPPPPPMYRAAPPPMFHYPVRHSPPGMDSNYDRCVQM